MAGTLGFFAFKKSQITLNRECPTGSSQHSDLYMTSAAVSERMHPCFPSVAFSLALISHTLSK